LFQLYVQWCQTVEGNSIQYLKSFILAKESIGVPPSTPNNYSTPNTAQESNKIEKVTVNFRPELKEIIKETKYLDKLGFMVPEAALNVALQV
jgi:dynein heavy chain, axonemal